MQRTLPLRRRRPGFTLLELLVALSMAAVIATMAIAMFLTVRLSSLETATRAQLARDGQAALDAIEHDLRFFGAGVPLGVNGDAVSTSASGKSLLPILRVARDDNLVFLGDQPYPNAELPGLASLAYVGLSGSDSHRLAVTSETSGVCIPPNSAPGTGKLGCRTSKTTLLPDLQSSADCGSSTPAITTSTTAADFQAARTCPWGMNKWLLGNGGLVYLTVVDAEGKWHERRNQPSGLGGADVDGFYRGTHLEHGFPASGDEFIGRPRFFAAAGGSYVTVMDRVFYAVEDTATAGTRCAGTAGGDCSLRRRQCWGRLEDPANANFPPAGTSSFVGSTSTQLNCTTASTPEDGTPWETIVSGVESVRFRYFQNATTQLAGSGTGAPLTSAQASAVRAIEVEVRLRRKIPGTSPARFLSDVMRRRFFLPNQQ
jgi:prepilin-type N-terminal cleavage/methylation domain-containing protein